MLSDAGIIAALESGDIQLPGTEYVYERMQPSSIDVCLDADFQVPIPGINEGVLDFKRDNSDMYRLVSVSDGDYFPLAPGKFVLGSTIEVLKLSNRIAAEVAGKSSLARHGLAVHVTAGFIDASFEGTVTLELYNHSENVMLLYPGMPVGQLVFHRLDSDSISGYVGKYRGQTGPTVSRYHENWIAETQSWK